MAFILLCKYKFGNDHKNYCEIRNADLPLFFSTGIMLIKKVKFVAKWS